MSNPFEATIVRLYTFILSKTGSGDNGKMALEMRTMMSLTLGMERSCRRLNHPLLLMLPMP